MKKVTKYKLKLNIFQDSNNLVLSLIENKLSPDILKEKKEDEWKRLKTFRLFNITRVIIPQGNQC